MTATAQNLLKEYNAAINASDQSQIDQLKKNLDQTIREFGNAGYTDFDYLRWLQGYNHNLDSVTRLLQNHFRHFKLWNLESVLAEGEDSISAKYYPHGLFREICNENNCLLFIEMTGRLDTEGLMKSASLLTLARSRVCGAEKIMTGIREQERKSGRQCRLIFIQDLDGFNWDWHTLWKLVSGPYKWWGDYCTQHYCELIDKFIVINTPSLVHHLWTIIKPWFPQRTRDKTFIVGKEYQELLLQFIDAEKLPKHWGGTLQDLDGDRMCRSVVRVPEKIPAELYWKPKQGDPKTEDLRELVAPSGTSSFLTFHVESPGSTILWYYFCDRTFGVGLYFSEEEVNVSSHEEALSSPKISCALPFFGNLQGPLKVPEQGRHVCDKIGYYKFEFRNEASWWQSLTVKYWIHLQPSD